MDFLNKIERYAGEDATTRGRLGQTARSLTLSEQLKEKLQYHRDQITKIESTLQILETNQDFEKILFLLGEVH